MSFFPQFSTIIYAYLLGSIQNKNLLLRQTMELKKNYLPKTGPIFMHENYLIKVPRGIYCVCLRGES